MNDAHLLMLTAAAIAALHTVLGPDHYLVFTAMGKARGWSLAKTLRVTTICGLGHIFGSIALGAIGLAIGAQLTNLVTIEGVRGNLASWALLSFGLVYLAWGIKQIGRGKSHDHVHSHGNFKHSHVHDHHGNHAHPHLETSGPRSITPWLLFIVFVLGPCEALIPLFMYPAAEHNVALVFAVAAIFGSVTLTMMLAGVVITTIGLGKLHIPSLSRYSHVAAGGSIAACGVATTFLGL